MKIQLFSVIDFSIPVDLGEISARSPQSAGLRGQLAIGEVPDGQSK